MVLRSEVVPIGIGEPGQAPGMCRIAVAGFLDHGQTLFGEPGGERGALGGVLAVVAEPLRDVFDRPLCAASRRASTASASSSIMWTVPVRQAA